MNIVSGKMRINALMILVGTVSMGCGEKKSKKSALTIKVKSADPGTALTLPIPGAQLATDTADEGAGNLSFTPESYRLWINTIVLQNDSSLSNQFYMCDSSAEECEVDFADPDSVSKFETKLSSIAINPGSYTKVWISCSPNSNGYMKFKGKVTLGDGTVVYTADKTANGGSPWTTDATKYDLLTIGGMGGGCGLTMPLAKTLEILEGDSKSEDSSEKESVAPGEAVTMTIFSNLQLATYYGKEISGGMGGCAIETGSSTGPGFCGNYPSVFPYFGETSPIVEYYRVANSATDSSTLAEADVNVLVKIILGADGAPFWASFGSIYEETTPNYASNDKAVSGYTNSVTNFAVNSDSSLTIKSQDYGFSSFKRQAHSGDVIGEGISNGAGTGKGVTYFYKAFPYSAK